MSAVLFIRKAPPMGSRVAKPPAPREAEVLKQILGMLRLRGIDCWRQNSGAMPVGSGSNRRYICFGPRNCPDIIGYLSDGRFLGIEVKRPGRRPTVDQLAALRRINEAGGIGFWADDLGVVDRVLDQVRAGFRVEVEASGDISFRPE